MRSTKTSTIRPFPPALLYNPILVWTKNVKAKEKKQNFMYDEKRDTEIYFFWYIRWERPHGQKYSPWWG